MRGIQLSSSTAWSNLIGTGYMLSLQLMTKKKKGKVKNYNTQRPTTTLEDY